MWPCSERRRSTLTPLARCALVLEDRVDVVHFAQPLEERDEVQQLGVGHVVEPRGHRHLDGNQNIQTLTLNLILSIEFKQMKK